MKVVIDTNILINAAGDEESRAFKILKEVIEGRIEAFATHQTMSENRQMLRKLISDREFRELVEEYFRVLNITKPRLNLPLPAEGGQGEKESGWVVSDPEDNKLFESIAASGAEYLISEDKEVLAVENWHGCEVITPAEFWAKYKNSSDDGSAWGDFTKMLMGN